MKEYMVTNYRYGLPVGSIVTEDAIDEDRLRFLAPIKQPKVVKKAKKLEEENK